MASCKEGVVEAVRDQLPWQTSSNCVYSTPLKYQRNVYTTVGKRASNQFAKRPAYALAAC